MKNITFCIASAKNEKDYTTLLLNSLKKNTQLENHEILIFLDSDNQNTYEHLLELQPTFPNLKIHRNETGFPIGSQRNVSIMFHHASNPIVCYLQSDMVAGKDLDKHISKNIDKNTVLSCARIEPPLHPGSPEKIVKDFGITPDEFKFDEFDKFVNELQKENRPNMDGHFAPFAVYKSTWFEQLGGFDTQFRCSREDSDMILRMKMCGLKTIQSWNACVYHFTCVSSRGNDWFKQNESADKKNMLQSKADHEELRRFIRKWGFFGHEYQPKFNTSLFIDIDTGVDIQLLKSIEPYFNKIYLNDLDVVQELHNQVKFDTYYYANKRWNYTTDHWNKILEGFNPVEFGKRIIYTSDFENISTNDIVISTTMYDLLKNINSQEVQGFITSNNSVFEQLYGTENYQGKYNLYNFDVIVNKLEDINEIHKNASQYLVPKIDTYLFN